MNATRSKRALLAAISTALAALILGALALGRLPLTPLRTHEWLLLGFGLSTFAWPVLLVFAVWAFALAWRESRAPTWSNNMFNVLQIWLGMLTVLALVALVGAIPLGLLGRPDMQIASPLTSTAGSAISRPSRRRICGIHPCSA